VQKIIQADPERLTVTKNASFAIALATEMFVQHLSLTTHNVVKTERKPRRNIQYRDVSSAVGRTDNLEFLGDVVPRTVQYGQWKRKKAAMDEEREKDTLTDVLGGDKSNGGGKGKGKGKAETRNGETQTTLPGISITSGAAQDLLARAGDGQTTSTTIEGAPVSQETPQTAPPQTASQLDPLARTELVPPVPETEAMDIDDQQVDSEAEEDPAAMQIEMEMRGPPAQRGEGKAAEESDAKPVPRVSTGGFTAINGR
jgi:DNA polymerase epsilon subunit 4